MMIHVKIVAIYIVCEIHVCVYMLLSENQEIHCTKKYKTIFLYKSVEEFSKILF